MTLSRAYALALFALAEEGKTSLGERLRTALEKKGRMHLIPKILFELKRLEEKASSMRTCHIVVAQESERERALLKARELIKSQGEDDRRWTLSVSVDPNLIGGYVVRLPDIERDASDRKLLYGLYQHLRSV